MTFELTPERLQEIAVGCVTQFIQKQASLNEAISKEAMDLELNPEQTKRVIEASNTIAYLRQLEKSADRTFEFEVADYGKVMANMTMPEDMLKAAGTPPWLDKDKDKKEDSKEDDKGEKKDSKDKDDEDEKKNKGEDFGKDKDDKKESKDKDEDDKEEDSDEEKQEKKAMLMQGYFQARETLEKMAYDEATLCMELVEAAGVVGKDVRGLEKLAFIVETEDFDKAVKLCGIEKRAQENLVFVDRDLHAAKNFYSLYKQANEFVTKKAELADFVARAETLLFKQPADLEKQAFIGKAIGAVAQGMGHAMGWVGGRAAKFAAKGVNNLGNGFRFSRAASGAGYKNTDEAIKAYDKIRSTQGKAAAQAKFGGRAPTYINRNGIMGGVVTPLATVTAGMGMTHKNNVKDI
jgi:hypothetical protein